MKAPKLIEAGIFSVTMTAALLGTTERKVRGWVSAATRKVHRWLWGTFALLFSFSVSAADSLELMLPQNNVSSRPIVEFRARTGVPGHAFILLGRELDNGFVVFNSVVGFYPDHDQKLWGLKLFVSTPGQVTATLYDASSDVAFRVNVTPVQEQKISAVMKKWDDKNYSLFSRNCVSLAIEVAYTLRLSVPGGDFVHLTPHSFVVGLKSLNEKDTPLKAGRKSIPSRPAAPTQSIPGATAPPPFQEPFPVEPRSIGGRSPPPPGSTPPTQSAPPTQTVAPHHSQSPPGPVPTDRPPPRSREQGPEVSPPR